jgi:preprotein translocase subunit SecG
MSTFYNLIVVVQVLSALAIIGLVLLQHGKGADMGAAFGSGASGSLFGATGSSNFMSKATGGAATIFFLATLGLAYIGSHRTNTVDGGVMEKAVKTSVIPATVPATAPAAPAASAPAAAPAPTAPAEKTPAGQIPK